MITQEKLKELFEYRDNELFWRVRPSNRVDISKPAGSMHKATGYRQIRIAGKNYRAHRLIYLYHHGFLPEFLDHIDNDRTNNDINNLREATYSQNMQNKSSAKNSSSKFLGVYWNKQTKKWQAQISINGKKKYLGLFVEEGDAAKAYNTAASEYHREFANLNRIGEILEQEETPSEFEKIFKENLWNLLA